MGRISCAAVGLSLLLAGFGCYQYDPPAEILLGKRFVSENRTATDRRLLNLSELTLGEARRIAELNNQNYQAAYHAVNAARMRYYQSLGAYAPEIHLGANTGQNLQWANNMVNPPMNLAGRDLTYQVNSTVMASWLLFDGFARYLTVQVSKSELKKADAERKRVMCMLRRAVAYAYYDLQLGKELQRIQAADTAFQRKLLDIVTPEVKEKKRPKDEQLNFFIFGGISESNYLSALNQARIADFSLAQLMGYSEGELPKKLTVEPFPRQLEKMYYSVDSCIDIALQNSPDMHIMRQLLDIARYNKYKSYSKYFPTVNANFGYTSTQMRSQYRDYSHSSSSYGSNSIFYGLSADYLIFNGLARYNAMREMQTLFAVAQFNMAETYLQIINAIRSAYSDYETAYAQFVIYRDLWNAAKEQRDLVEERYLRYDVSVDRVDKVETYWVDVQTQYAVSVTNFRKAIAQLEAIMMIDVYGTSFIPLDDNVLRSESNAKSDR